MGKNITIVGGGSSAHTLVPLLSLAGHKVSILTSRPREWSARVEAQLQSPEGEITETFDGELSLASNMPEHVIPTADIVVLCMPVSKYRAALHRIAPYLRNHRDVFVGAMYGQAGVNWMIDEVRRKFRLDQITSFTIGLLPWICRTLAYGKVGINYGSKAVNVAAISSPDAFDHLNDVFLRDICERHFGAGKFLQARNFLSLTLSVDNQIIHPSRCYGLFLQCKARWKTEDDVPYFYRDFDQRSADVLQELDADYTAIRETIAGRYPGEDFSYMLDYLALERLSYQSANTDICESFTTSRTLGAIKPPTVQDESGTWVIDRNHRFFTDDIHYGLCIAKWLAERLDLRVTTIDRILEWAQSIRGEQLIERGQLAINGDACDSPFKYGVPSVYGHRSIDQLIG